MTSILILYNSVMFLMGVEIRLRTTFKMSLGKMLLGKKSNLTYILLRTSCLRSFENHTDAHCRQ